MEAWFITSVPEGGASADDFGLLSDGGGHIETPEESVMFDTFLPEIFAVIPLVKVELNNVLVVTLQNCELNFWKTFTFQEHSMKE